MYAVPTCGSPVGLGPIRTRTGRSVMARRPSTSDVHQTTSCWTQSADGRVTLGPVFASFVTPMRTSGNKVIFGLVLATTAWLGKACVFQEDDQPAPPLPLDQPLGPGQVRAGIITKDSELIGGVTA